MGMRIYHVLGYYGASGNGCGSCQFRSEYSEEYSDYLYAIIVDVNGIYDRCEIIISEFLEKFDGEDKIKKTVSYIAELISIRWPEIELNIDTTIKREQD